MSPNENLTYENEIDLYEHNAAGKAHFHLKWFRKHTKTPAGSDPEAKGNSEIPHSYYI